MLSLWLYLIVYVPVASIFFMIWFIQRAVIQLYPETPEQMELISKTATKCGFTGGLVVDYPNRYILLSLHYHS